MVLTLGQTLAHRHPFASLQSKYLAISLFRRRVCCRFFDGFVIACQEPVSLLCLPNVPILQYWRGPLLSLGTNPDQDDTIFTTYFGDSVLLGKLRLDVFDEQEEIIGPVEDGFPFFNLPWLLSFLGFWI